MRSPLMSDSGNKLYSAGCQRVPRLLPRQPTGRPPAQQQVVLQQLLLEWKGSMANRERKEASRRRQGEQRSSSPRGQSRQRSRRSRQVARGGDHSRDWFRLRLQGRPPVPRPRDRLRQRRGFHRGSLPLTPPPPGSRDSMLSRRASKHSMQGSSSSSRRRSRLLGPPPRPRSGRQRC